MKRRKEEAENLVPEEASEAPQEEEQLVAPFTSESKWKEDAIAYLRPLLQSLKADFPNKSLPNVEKLAQLIKQ